MQFPVVIFLISVLLQCTSVAIGKPSEKEHSPSFSPSKGREYMLGLSSYQKDQNVHMNQRGDQAIQQSPFKGNNIVPVPTKKEEYSSQIPDSLVIIGPNSKITPGSASERFEIPFIRSPPNGHLDMLIRWAD
ncbi:GSCOCG00006746001-RA-CDS [Cotesia congregata]|nr:GSCOCG00006746001-RA-CDS [Cotesia congregata]